MTLREIGKQLQLSASTISVCLYGSPEKLKISPKTVKRVREYAERIGYVPNILARRLYNHEASPPIGIIYKLDTATDRSMPLLNQTISRLNERGREFIVQSCKPEGLLATCRILLGMKIRQVILIGYTFEYMLKGFEQLRDLELFIPDYVPNLHGGAMLPVRCRCSCNQDPFLRGFARRLVELGAGPLAADENTAYVVEPECLAPGAVVMIPESQDWFSSGQQVAETVCGLVKSGRCRTLLLHNDRIAIGLIEALLPRGIRIPEDLAVIGFNNSEFAPHAVMPLSTIALPIWENMQLILDHLLDGKELPAYHLNQVHFIPRQTTPKSFEALASFQLPIDASHPSPSTPKPRKVP